MSKDLIPLNLLLKDFVTSHGLRTNLLTHSTSKNINIYIYIPSTVLLAKNDFRGFSAFRGRGTFSRGKYYGTNLQMAVSRFRDIAFLQCLYPDHHHHPQKAPGLLSYTGQAPFTDTSVWMVLCEHVKL